MMAYVAATVSEAGKILRRVLRAAEDLGLEAQVIAAGEWHLGYPESPPKEIDNLGGLLTVEIPRSIARVVAPSGLMARIYPAETSRLDVVLMLGQPEPEWTGDGEGPELGEVLDPDEEQQRAESEWNPSITLDEDEGEV